MDGGSAELSGVTGTIRRMARIFVEGWHRLRHPARPGRGPLPAEGSVDATVETDDWSPIEGVDDLVDRIAFVDGVRRVDARLTLDDPVHGPTPGIVGTFAVGAVVWHRTERRAEVTDVRIERWAVLAGGSGSRCRRARAGGRHDPHARRRSRPADDDPALEDARRRG